MNKNDKQQINFEQNEENQRKKLLYVWYSLCFSAGSKTAKKIYMSFNGDIEKIYNATESEYSFEKYKRIGKSSKKLCDKDLFEAHKTLYDCKRFGVEILTYQDSLYPESLKQLEDSPVVLYYKGSFEKLSQNKFLLGAVGTRNASQSASDKAYQICSEIAQSGGIIVTGLAKGIDTVCIRAAIDNGYFGIGVLGTSIEKIYPSQNKDVFDYMAKNGLIISEYPPLTYTTASSFALRNRIISGLSVALAVFEAGETSGSMLTADFARKQGKGIFAIPGSPDDVNKSGCNLLIKNGAWLLTSGDDIISKFGQYFLQKQTKATELTQNNSSPKPQQAQQKAAEKEEQIEEQIEPCLFDEQYDDLTQSERAVLACFKDQPLHSDEISVSGLGTRDILSTLTMLEIKDYICSLPGGRFAKNVK